MRHPERDEINLFIKSLRKYRHILNKQTVNTIKGQALSGDLNGAITGLKRALERDQTNQERFTNAHRQTRYIIRLPEAHDVDYRTQFAINLKGMK